MKHLRMVLSFLLIMFLMAGMFTGCKNDPEPENTEASQTKHTENEISRDPVGSFIVNAGAILELFYNEDGLIVDAASKNSDATAILDNDPQLFGASCADAVVELLPHFLTLKSLEKNGNALLLKSAPGSKEPSETFLTDISTALKEVANNQALTLHIFAFNTKDLNFHGEMTVEQAMTFLLQVLSISEEDYNFMNATNHSVQGNYAFQIGREFFTEDYLVNALTGDIMEGSVDSSFFDGSDSTSDIAFELPEETQETTQETTQEIEIEIEIS